LTASEMIDDRMKKLFNGVLARAPNFARIKVEISI
jgi:hypothetical protein